MKYLIVVIFCLFVASFVFAAEKIDINTASLEDLVKIIYIGEIRALELISLRPFSSLDDLARIKGIGEKSVEAIKKQGLAWVAPMPENKTSQSPQEQPAAQESPQNTPAQVSQGLAQEKITETEYPQAKIELASVGEQMPKNRNAYFLFIAAAFTSFFSGGIILILKKKLKLD